MNSAILKNVEVEERTTEQKPLEVIPSGSLSSEDSVSARVTEVVDYMLSQGSMPS